MKLNDYNLKEYRVPARYSEFHDAANLAGINAEDVRHLMACVPGEADGFSWHWVYVLKDDTYGYMTGWCDYTGWDCQAWATAIKNTDLDALFDVMEEGLDEYGLSSFKKRKVKEQLKAQIEGKQPYALDVVGE